ncbi:MAG: RNA polymerase sigma factor [Candidatus Binataceae bacterium]
MPNLPVQTDYDHVYRGYHARIMRLSRLLLSDPREAEDVTQEVFLKAFQRWKNGDEPEVWIAWLLRVTVNACQDRRSSAWWRRWRGHTEEWREELHPAIEGAESQFRSHEQYQRIWRHFRHLPQRQREIFALRHLEGRSTAEVAEALNLSVGSVKRHLFRAVQRLRKVIGEES